jgi:hypothetical protein
MGWTRHGRAELDPVVVVFYVLFFSRHVSWIERDKFGENIPIKIAPKGILSFYLTSH